MQLNHHKIVLGMQTLFQVILLALMTWPPFLVSQSLHAINWRLFLPQLLFQFLLNQCFFLFSRQRDLAVLQTPLLLLGGELLLLTIIFSHFQQGFSTAGQLLVVQWLLVHTALASMRLLPLSTFIVYSGQIVIYQKILEMTQTYLLWDNEIIFYFLLCTGLLIGLKLLLPDDKLGPASRRFLGPAGLVISMAAVGYGLAFTELAASHVIMQLILSALLLFVAYLIHLKIKLHQRQVQQLQATAAKLSD